MSSSSINTKSSPSARTISTLAYSGVDPIAVFDIQERIYKLREMGLGVLLTDHNVRETLAITDRAYIIHEGTVLMEGAPSEIVSHEDVRRVYLGETFSL